jgi:hypothetical protein
MLDTKQFEKLFQEETMAPRPNVQLLLEALQKLEDEFRVIIQRCQEEQSQRDRNEHPKGATE